MTESDQHPAEGEPAAAGAAPADGTGAWPDPESLSLAQYVALSLTARHGYKAGHFPEAAPLAGAADLLLTRHDGYNLAMLCLIDRERHPERRFELPVEEVRRIGEACLQYTGRMGATPLPVTITILEVGAGPASPANRERLASYRRKSYFSRVHLAAVALDAGAGTAWSNASPIARPALLRPFRRLLQRPRDAALIRPYEPVAVNEAGGRPWLTYATLAVLVAAFGLELLLPVAGFDWSPLGISPQTLIALGGSFPPLIREAGEWHRLLIAPLLHGGLFHIAMNGIVLYAAGGQLEALVGRAWFAAIYLLGGLTGAMLSFLLGADNVVSVGASGAVTALLAALAVIAYRFPPGPDRTAILMGILPVLIPALLPIAQGIGGLNIDVAAHFGGAIGGALLALLMRAVWPAGAALPGLRPLAMGLGTLLLAATLWSVVAAARHYPEYAGSLGGCRGEACPGDARGD